jgi:hypothetical protein
MRIINGIIKSLIVPFFNGIYMALSGGLGGVVALCAWLQVFLQGGVSAAHTVNASATIALATVFLGGQALAALCSFLFLNGLASETKARQKNRYFKLALAASIGSAIIGGVTHGAGCLIVGFFSPVSGISGLVGWGADIAALQAVIIVSALIYQINHRP